MSIGTGEVANKIIFFDRENINCSLRIWFALYESKYNQVCVPRKKKSGVANLVSTFNNEE